MFEVDVKKHDGEGEGDELGFGVLIFSLEYCEKNLNSS